MAEQAKGRSTGVRVGSRGPNVPTPSEVDRKLAEGDRRLAEAEQKQTAAAAAGLAEQDRLTHDRREVALTCAALVYKGRRVRGDRVLLLARDLEQYLANG